MAANRRIRLRTTYATQEEGRVSAEVYPGARLQIGTDGRFAHNGTAAAGGPCRIAEEDLKIGRTVDDPYATGELAKFFYPLPGDHVNVRLKTGNNAAIGSLLVNDNTGGYTVRAAETTGIEFQAIEALNNAAGVYQLVRAVKL